MKRNKNAIHLLFALMLALGLMIGMGTTAFAADAKAGEKGVGFTRQVDYWLNQDGDSKTITIPDQYTEVVLGVTVDSTRQLHFHTDSVCARATLYHQDGSYYDSQYNGFNMFDVGFAGETYYLNCSVVDGYTDMTYTVSYDNDLGVMEADKDNPLDIKGKTARIKYSKLKKKSRTLDVTKAIRFIKEGEGETTYSLVSAKKAKKSFKKYFRIGKKTGKITVKKGLKKGTYKVRIKVNAAGNNGYKAKASTVTVVIIIR